MDAERKKPKRTGGKNKKAYSNMMLVRILGKEKGEIWGEIVHLNLLNPVPYRGPSELVVRIVGIAEFLNLVEESKKLEIQEDYSCGDGREREGNALPKEYRRIVSTRKRAQDGFGQSFHLKEAQEVICVELLGGYHSSLQGRVRYRSKRECCTYFRSAMELMLFFGTFIGYRGGVIS